MKKVIAGNKKRKEPKEKNKQYKENIYKYIIYNKRK